MQARSRGRKLLAHGTSSDMITASYFISKPRFIIRIHYSPQTCGVNHSRSIIFPHSTSLQVTVKTLEKGFLINVFCDKNRPGLLVSVLEAFEELGLEVLDASISCADSFRLEAVGGEVSS